MDFLTYLACALLVVLATLVISYFLAKWSLKLDEKDHKKWAMNHFKYTEEEYEEYKRLSKLEQVERDKDQRQESLEVLEFMRKKYGND